MKIDSFTHVMPQRFYRQLKDSMTGPDYLSGLIETLPELADMDARIRVMDKLGVDKQVITLSSPPIEVVVQNPVKAAELATIANEEILEIASKNSDRFIPVGTVAMSSPETMAKEAERCLTELGMKGMLIYSSAAGRAIDGPEFNDFYAVMAEQDYPIWLHPARSGNQPDYVGEKRSKYWIWQVFGWPFETTAAMTRLVYAGIFERYPDIKIITHHAGAMVPYFEKRIDYIMDNFQLPELVEARENLQRPPSEYFRMFYGDTALMGSVNGMTAAYGYLGSKHLLFGTDTPYDGEGGQSFTESTIFSIKALVIPPAEREMIFAGNAIKMLKLDG